MFVPSSITKHSHQYDLLLFCKWAKIQLQLQKHADHAVKAMLQLKAFKKTGETFNQEKDFPKTG